MTVRGGLGDDVIWSNGGNNWLFGDAGDDKIVGAGGDDIIVGGADNDTLHGGGGEDTFCFGGKWGDDSIEQCEGGISLLWFDGMTRDELSLDADTDGNAVLRSANGSVTLHGVKAAEVADAFNAGGNELAGSLTLKFGNDGTALYEELQMASAFDAFTSERIFEEKEKGMLA